MNGADALIQALKREGVDLIFGYPGGAIMPVYDALVDSNIKHVLVRHEQGAALAADGYARASGRVGVCLATSGPGATNLVTGIANAYADSVPMVAITGQVPTALLGTDAFQEVDILGITLPVVKHSYLIKRAVDIPQVVRDAFSIARSGRPGPVLIDLPKDVAADVCGPLPAPSAQPRQSVQAAAPELYKARERIDRAQRPVIYAGGGIGIARAVAPFRSFVESTGIPVVSTLKGLGALPTSHAQFLGMLGMHGSKAANHAVQEADLLIVIGARFDDRATGKLSEFAPGADVIHLDIDASEVGKLRTALIGVVGELETSLEHLRHARPAIEEWRAHCNARRAAPVEPRLHPDGKVNPTALLGRLFDRARSEMIVTCDVGQHQMWVAQHGQFDRPEDHLSSGGLGTMGYGLPAAIGAQFARPSARVITVSGDGSFLMNVQELATAKRYDLPIRILLFDNSALGLVRQWQELFYSSRFSEVDLSDNPDFVKVAEAFGFHATRLDKGEDVEDALDDLLYGEGPRLLHVVIEPTAMVWPLVPPGASNSVMMEEQRT